ncbi:Flagellar biosynthetic protein FlhB [Burkholderiales bacterium]|nr:Flagellar biosynthetic protein FlhB [Burkholderiales bacterium]
MAEDNSDLERTESATPRRLEQAREEGQIPRSRELASFALLGGAAIMAWLLLPQVSRDIQRMLAQGLTFDRALAFDPQLMLATVASEAWAGLLAIAPILGLLTLFALVAPLLLSGWNFSSKALELKFDRLDPWEGLKRMFSAQGLAQLGLALAKTLLIVGFAAWAMWHEREATLGLVGENLEAGIAHMARIVGWCFLVIAGSLGVLAAMDVPFQLWSYHKKMRMTKDEVRRESKEQEGDPHLKAHIRAQQREIARRRMMSEVPKADVVVTNPTHYAVALSYQNGQMRAPKVVAKGAGVVAQKIRELALEHAVPVLEAPPLARALYRHSELDMEIPQALFGAVAEVLAWVYQLRAWKLQGGPAPEAPAALEVPAELDPGVAT